jgi:acetolactate synthase-1/2/3 large subunit
MPKITGAHLVMRCLKQEGIKRIFTVVGDTILPLCDAAEDEGMQFIDTRHEAAAMAMADAWCRLTGEPAVAMVTGGPGFSNAISGLPNIYTSESPVVFIAGCSELPEQGMYSFQEIDQIGLASPITKGSWLVHHKKRIPDMVATAFRTALSGRPGPVHLSIPMDIQEAAVSEEELPQYQPSEYRHQGRNPGDPRLVDRALDLLSGAEKPVAIAANASRYSVTSNALEALLEATGIPLFTVEQARGLVSDDHPLCFGYADGSLNQAARHFREADVVLLLGKRLDHRFRYGNPPFFNSEARIIQVDPSPEDLGRNRGVALGILGHLGAVVEQLTAGASARNWKDLSPWASKLNESRRVHLESLETHATDDVPIHAMRVFKEVQPFIDEDSILIFDGGDYVQWGRGYLKAHKPGHWLRLGPLAHLGFGLPYALAARLAYPESKVFLFIGDGSVGFYTMEFDTALRHNLPFTTILGNDSVWGIDRNFQKAYYGRAVATDLRTIRYDRVVEAIGGHGEHVESPQDLGPAISRALASGKPSLVDITIRSVQSPLADAMITRRLAAKQA